ncbi:hypothetical protein [Streptomyces sp. SID13588]|uniref:hypothetical protein n=1 Tax=Streptomyces sp. SID13588 TaxID=2706051 RepID=UPI0013C606C3|nr:hypothetical protein [Streptomyces sp. SID13588]NEA72736.1 hypothetical protein [Streptomyces sp. SID13588]
MPATTPRPHIMALLFDLDFDHPGRTFHHLDGRPFTKEELAVANEATLEEFRAAGAKIHTEITQEIADQALNDASELLRKYFAQDPEVVIPYMTDEDHGHYESLLAIASADGGRFLPRRR